MSGLSLPERVIESFGGLTEASRAIGAPITTIDSWRASKRGIPSWRIKQIREAAQKANVVLPDDFPKEEEAAA